MMSKVSILGFTVYWNHGQDEPRGPLWEVLDKHQGHEGADHDEIGLLQSQRALPMNGDHSHHTEIPDQECNSDVVHGDVVGFKHFPKQIKHRSNVIYVQ